MESKESQKHKKFKKDKEYLVVTIDYEGSDKKPWESDITQFGAKITYPANCDKIWKGKVQKLSQQVWTTKVKQIQRKLDQHFPLLKGSFGPKNQEQLLKSIGNKHIMAIQNHQASTLFPQLTVEQARTIFLPPLYKTSISYYLATLADPPKPTDPDAYFVVYVRGDKKLSAKSQELTGITEDTLKMGFTLKQGLELFIIWLNALAAEYQLIFLAHNGIGYDAPLLCSNLHRYHMLNKLQGIFVHTFDSLGWCKAHLDSSKLLDGEFGKSYRLGDLYRAAFGKEFKGAHDAKADIDALDQFCHGPWMKHITKYQEIPTNPKISMDWNSFMQKIFWPGQKEVDRVEKRKIRDKLTNERKTKKSKTDQQLTKAEIQRMVAKTRPKDISWVPFVSSNPK